jgi:hypothetical protein
VPFLPLESEANSVCSWAAHVAAHRWRWQGKKSFRFNLTRGEAAFIHLPYELQQLPD